MGATKTATSDAVKFGRLTLDRKTSCFRRQRPNTGCAARVAGQWVQGEI